MANRDGFDIQIGTSITNDEGRGKERMTPSEASGGSSRPPEGHGGLRDSTSFVRASNREIERGGRERPESKEGGGEGVEGCWVAVG